MALYPRLPNPSYPSGRYTRTNPLRREFGLRLLSEPLPEPLRTAPGVVPPATMAKKLSRTCTASAPPKPVYPALPPASSAGSPSPNSKSPGASSKRQPSASAAKPATACSPPRATISRPSTPPSASN